MEDLFKIYLYLVKIIVTLAANTSVIKITPNKRMKGICSAGKFVLEPTNLYTTPCPAKTPFPAYN